MDAALHDRAFILQVWLGFAMAVLGIVVSCEEAAGSGEKDGRGSFVPGTVVEPPAPDTDFEGWGGEGLAEVVGKKLKEELRGLSDPEAVAKTSFRVAFSVPGTGHAVAGGISLRGVSVRRAPGTDPGVPATTGGVEAFRERLHDLFDRGSKEALNPRVSVKITGVETGGDFVTTSALVQIAGFDEDGRCPVQVNASVTARWDQPDGGGSGGVQLDEVRVDAYEEVVVADPSPVRFEEMAADVLGGTSAFRGDLRFGTEHWLDRIALRFGMTVGGWNGLALGDVNGDKIDDLYICNTGGLPNRLFVRNADGRIEERAAEAGVDWLECSQAALFLDLDNDGDQDLVVSTLSGVLVQENDGAGGFQVRRAVWFPSAFPYSLAAADYDLDGDLDLFAACYSRRTGPGQRDLFLRPLPYHDARNGGRNVLLRNEGGWRFSQVTKASGLDDGDRRFSYAAAWEDYDRDGDPDLYVANDFGRNTLYRNDGERGRGGSVRFTEVAGPAGVTDIAAGMSVVWGDYDNDGEADLYVGNMFSSAGSRLAGAAGFLPRADEATRALFKRHARGNSLFRNLGKGRFDDVSVGEGVALGRWAWGSKFADLNNDGWKDIVVANGFITQADTGDL